MNSLAARQLYTRIIMKGEKKRYICIFLSVFVFDFDFDNVLYFCFCFFFVLQSYTMQTSLLPSYF